MKSIFSVNSDHDSCESLIDWDDKQVIELRTITLF